MGGVAVKITSKSWNKDEGAEEEGTKAKRKRSTLNPDAEVFVPASSGRQEADDDEDCDEDSMIGGLVSEEGGSFKPKESEEEDNEDEEHEPAEESGEEDQEDEAGEATEKEDLDEDMEESEENKRGYDDEMATMQTQNVTELMKNYVSLIEEDIDINFMQECKLKEGDRNKVEGFFKDKDYDLTCGPSNCQTKKPSAGVGCASRKGKAEVITPKHLTKAFEDAWEMG